MTRRTVGFALVVVLVCAGAAWLVSLVANDPLVSRAAWTSAAVAIGVQLAGFAAARVLVVRKAGVFVAWGAAMAVRFGSLAIYTLLVFKVLRLVPAPALVTFAGLLMVTSMVEPLFLTER